jgi:hypothetical protein
MTPERFHQIVEAYGADPQRWPPQQRAAAQAWAGLHRQQAQAWLDEAAGLDAWLATDRLAPPDTSLQQRIVASAPARRVTPQRRTWWWSGAAVAGVGLLGGLAGALAVSFFVLTDAVPPVHESSYLTSSFGGSSADWSGE